MRRATRILLFLLPAIASLSAAPVPERVLTFAERVAAQRAFERVYFSHQIGATRSFEQTFPSELLDEKVRDTLRKSAALETFWHSPVTAEALRRESERIASRTRLPARLREIYAALGDDEFLFEESLARSVLVDRLTRDFFAADAGIHRARRGEAERLRALRERGDRSRLPGGARRTVVEIVRAPGEGRSGDEVTGTTEIGSDGGRLRRVVDEEEFSRERDRVPRRPGEIGPLREERDGFVFSELLADDGDRLVVANVEVSKVSWEEWWASVKADLDPLAVGTVASPPASRPLSVSAEEAAVTGCPADNTWDNGALDDLPDPRELHTAVWTGSLMVVWGGQQTGGGALATGGRYDPISDAWTPTSTVNAAGGRNNHTAVWTGTEMLVWGGKSSTFALNSGGRYNPATDIWAAMSSTGAPAGRFDQVAIWTGSLMVVWGGYNSTYVNTGGRYNPSSNTWSATSLTLPPAARTGARAVWTGSLMVVWGGYNGSYLDSGGRYDPTLDSWSDTSLTNAAAPRRGHSAVWTGTSILIWGGEAGGNGLATGGQYDPVANNWSATSAVGAPGGRRNHTAVWTGSRMIVWGGSESASLYLDSGGRYDPAGSGNWTPTSMGSAPAPRTGHSAVWTGSVMIVWGGTGASGASLSSGGRYDLVTDSWSKVSAAGAPGARKNHTAVWTGDTMIVWGGDDASPLDTGGRYNPAADAWTATSLVNVPTARTAHSAIWSGSVMVVWGGTDSSTVLGTGGRYDPSTDSWSATSMSGAPSPRQDHTAVWTGAVMIVWGGRDGSGALNTGAQYLPGSDTWLLATSTGTGIAPARYRHTAVWTGTVMMVWGGTNGTSLLSSGSRYNPGANTWALTSVFGSPTARSGHSAIWIGGAVVIWGGLTTSYQNNGARYNPATDLWSAMATVGAPAGRANHTAVGGGGWMLIWGGSGNSYLNTGGRYAFGASTDADGDGYSTCAGDCNDASAAIHPGAVELCNQVDDNCDGIVDEGFDADGDGFSACGGKDCNDSDPAVWAAPSEVTGLQVSTSSPANPWWADQNAASGSGTVYDLVSGALAATPGINFAAGSCLASGGGPSYSDARPSPPVGGGYWYLVRARNSCAAGTYGSASRDAASPSCP